MFRQFVLKCVVIKKPPDVKPSLVTTNVYSTDGKTSETEIKAILEKRFPEAKAITVEDVSGGCGAMYDIFVETCDFKGLSIVKQHQTVTSTLKEQIKLIHGLRIVTKAA